MPPVSTLLRWMGVGGTATECRPQLRASNTPSNMKGLAAVVDAPGRPCTLPTHSCTAGSPGPEGSQSLVLLKDC